MKGGRDWCFKHGNHSLDRVSMKVQSKSLVAKIPYCDAWVRSSEMFWFGGGHKIHHLCINDLYHVQV